MTKTKLVVMTTVWVASLLSSVYITKNYVEGQVAKAKLETLEALVDNLQLRSDQDFEAAVKRAKAEAAAAERTRLAKVKGVDDATKKADVRCDRDDESYSLLIDAIDAASGSDPTGSLRTGVPTNPQANGIKRPADTVVGVRNSGSFWRVPADASRVRAVVYQGEKQ